MGITKTALKKKKPLSDEHFIPADDAQAQALALSSQKVQLARFSGDESQIEAAMAEQKDIQDQIRKDGLVFDIRGVGRLRFEELVREHPPTDPQKEGGATFNPDTFWPALFSESIEGTLTPEDWRESVFDSPDWGPGEIHDLREKVKSVNTGTRVGELGN